jgi:hypothetical protein
MATGPKACIFANRIDVDVEGETAGKQAWSWNRNVPIALRLKIYCVF